MSRCLFVGSTAAYSGKSAIILGLASHLKHQGMAVAYGKPLGACMGGDCLADGSDPDVKFIGDWLGLTDECKLPTIARLDPETVMGAIDETTRVNYPAKLAAYQQQCGAQLKILEGPGDLQEGQLFQLSLAEMATKLDAAILLLVRYDSAVVVDTVLGAQRLLGNRLIGVVFNDVPADERATVTDHVVPYLEHHHIPVLGILPANRILRSISVSDLVHQLDAQILCCEERLDLLVEEIAIGAMNVNSALKYFRKSEHKAVITGGDRTDIQQAAL